MTNPLSPTIRVLSLLVLVSMLCFLPAATSTAAADPGSGELMVRVPRAVPGSHLLRALAAKQMDILSVGRDGAVVITTTELLNTLNLGAGDFQVLREDLSVFHTSCTSQVEASEFHTYGELADELAALADSWSGIAALHQIGQSVEGRPIWALKISDNVNLDESDEPRILLVGCHHAREWISVETTLLIGRHLLEQSGAGGQAAAAVDGAEIWVVPMLNPDGHIYSVEEDRLWRKNRRNNGNGSWGVDLNRNYGYRWGHDDEGSSGNPNAGTYRGTGPFSEPESSAVRDLMSIGRPFSALISYHNFSQVVLKAWGYTSEPTADDAYFLWLSRSMANMITAVYGVPYEGGGNDLLYLVNGDTVDWAYGTFRIPAFTIELRPGPNNGLDGFVNPPSDIQPTFEENLPAALWLIEQAMAGLPLGGDMDFSGRVDGIDLGQLSYAFGSGEDAEQWLPPADLDGNGVVDGDDLTILSFFFGFYGWGVLPF